MILHVSQTLSLDFQISPMILINSASVLYGSSFFLSASRAALKRLLDDSSHVGCLRAAGWRAKPLGKAGIFLWGVARLPNF